MLARFGAPRALAGMIHVGGAAGHAGRARRSFAAAAGFIVGSSVKRGGLWSNPLDRARAEAVARAFERLPEKA